jgi:hypothetical protein
MLIESSNKRKGSLLPSRLHSGIALISRLIGLTFSQLKVRNLCQNRTYLSVILGGGTQIYIHLHVTFNLFPGFQP